MPENIQFQLLLATFAGWVSRQQSAVICYLVEENRVLKEQLESSRRRVRFTDEEEPDGVFCEARAVREGSRVRVCVVARRPERDLQKPQRGRGRKSRDKAKSARFQPISWFFSGFARSSSLCNHLLFSQSQSGHRSGFTFVKGRRRLALRLGFEFSRNYLPLRAEHRNSLHVCHRSDLIDHLSFLSQSRAKQEATRPRRRRSKVGFFLA